MCSGLGRFVFCLFRDSFTGLGGVGDGGAMSSEMSHLEHAGCVVQKTDPERQAPFALRLLINGVVF